MRPQRPCRSPHGTNARYVAGCSCIECCDAHAAYLRERGGTRAPGTSVPLDVVLAHVQYLQTMGMSRRAIGEMSGTSYKTIRNITDRAITRVNRETGDAILALRGPVESDTTALIPAYPTLRLIERLRKHNSLDKIAQAVGVSRRSLPQKGQRTVQARTAKRIREAAASLRGVA